MNRGASGACGPRDNPARDVEQRPPTRHSEEKDIPAFLFLYKRKSIMPQAAAKDKKRKKKNRQRRPPWRLRALLFDQWPL
jgi:hypothetical protein